ncbi:hypothetical protein TcasGA2_TC011492 [Tribolium castaneum]|uniref:Uncharacterized protein n=1 Tax=Tribolium castaneum TaxID=7070 RepID=D7EK75_TRICA|nr:hypothetical protein TcasGA2_TC011492 [Tribolium castaneum]
MIYKIVSNTEPCGTHFVQLKSFRTQTFDASLTSPESTIDGISRSFRALILGTSLPTLNGIPRSSPLEDYKYAQVVQDLIATPPPVDKFLTIKKKLIL